MRNAKTSKKMALVVLLMLIILCLSAFFFSSSATSGFAENSTGVMGDVISKPVSNITTPLTGYDSTPSKNLGEIMFRSGGDDFLQVIYPKKITIIKGDELADSDGPRLSNEYGDGDQPRIKIVGHYGPSDSTDYQTIINTIIWGNTCALNDTTQERDLFHQYFRDYSFDD